MENFAQAFEHNFYLTEEFVHFCSRVADIPLQKQIIENQIVFTLKNKNISISDYSDTICNQFKKAKISYLRVLSKINDNAVSPSLREYSIFYKTTYENAFKKYDMSFHNGLRRGKHFPHKCNIIRQPDGQLIQKIYDIYIEQMRRHNPFLFPISFFKEFFKCPSSILFTVEYEQNIIAYSCCFQYGDNLYLSIGGGDPRYFCYGSSNKLYDEFIKYACLNNFNIHMGTGMYGSGYQKFKQNVGTINYKTEQFPDNDKFLKLAMPLLKFRIINKALVTLAQPFSHLIAYLAMPFT